MTKSKDTNDKTPDSQNDLVALLELRDFLATELDPIGTQNQVDRALKPLTDGLGLESPKDALTNPQVTPASVQVTTATDGAKEKFETPKVVQGRSAYSPAVSDDRPTVVENKEKGLAEVFETYQAPESGSSTSTLAEETDPDLLPVAPPPLPKASFVRRFFAGLLDEVFILSLFVLAFGLTLKMLTGGSAVTLETVRGIDNNTVLRFALLEYATLWLAYFAIGVGVLDSTFGMWVWGLRLSYPKDRIGAVVWRKGIRIIASFLFYAPILPVLLLGFRFRGRNLLDLLSGTTLYRTLG